MTELEKIDEAIQTFDDMAKSHRHRVELAGADASDSDYDWIDLCETALCALREKWERMKPEALTIERLREMKRQPVYHSRLGWGVVGYKEYSDSKHWGVAYQYGFEWLEDLLQSGKLYVHKPEEEATQ